MVGIRLEHTQLFRPLQSVVKAIAIPKGPKTVTEWKDVDMLT